MKARFTNKDPAEGTQEATRRTRRKPGGTWWHAGGTQEDAQGSPSLPMPLRKNIVTPLN